MHTYRRPHLVSTSLSSVAAERSKLEARSSALILVFSLSPLPALSLPRSFSRFYSKTKYVFQGDCVTKPECGTDTFIDDSGESRLLFSFLREAIHLPLANVFLSQILTARSCTPCSSIESGSATCDATKALSCLPGSFLLGGKCPTSGPDGYYADSDKNQCIACTEIDSDAATVRIPSALHAVAFSAQSLTRILFVSARRPELSSPGMFTLLNKDTLSLC